MAFQWLLARKADSLGASPAKDAQGFRLYVQDGDSEAGAPTIWSLYRVGDDEVEVIDLKFVEFQDEYEED